MTKDERPILDRREHTARIVALRREAEAMIGDIHDQAVLADLEEYIKRCCEEIADRLSAMERCCGTCSASKPTHG